MQTEPINYSGAYMGYGVDNSLSFDEFRKNLRVEVMSLNQDDIEFDIVGIDASLANAFRRILIAEVRNWWQHAHDGFSRDFVFPADMPAYHAPHVGQKGLPGQGGNLDHIITGADNGHRESLHR